MNALNFFVSSQLLVCLGALIALTVRKLARQGALTVSAAAELRVHYVLLGLLALLLVAPLPERESFAFHRVAHVELGKAVFSSSGREGALPVVTLPGAPKGGGLPLGLFSWICLALVSFGLAAVLRDYLRLALLLRRSVVFRSIGRVRIAVAEGLASPLSARGISQAWVVLPPSFLEDPLALSIAVAHELQHHRAADTLWCHVLAPLRALCFFHPLRRLWAAVVAEAQELACDEVLVTQRRRVSAGDYSRVLIRAAECAAKGKTGRAYAAAPSLFSERRLLARRIENMFDAGQRQKRNGKWMGVLLSSLAGITLAAGAWGSGNWVVDSRVSGRTMVAMAEEARKGTEFPIQVNGEVLRELNRYLGTEKGRDFVAKARVNLEKLRPMLEHELADHRVPAELLAVGLVESGYENLPQSSHPMHSAGVWQCIPSTARIYGLRVDEQVDERLNETLETDAAFRYLSANHERFGDWLLAVMAYNMGERNLDAAIRKTGTRDPWKLIAMGYEGDKGYLARFMAGVLILKSPPASR